MGIGKEKQDEIRKAIEEKIKISKGALNDKAICSLCGQRSFSIVDGYTNLPITDNISGNLVIGGPTLPCAVLICNNCGNTLFVNLIILGVINNAPK